MLDSVGGAIDVHVYRYRVIRAHVQQLLIYEQRNTHLNQVESHKQDTLDVHIKSNRGAINLEIGVAKGLFHHVLPIEP